MALSAQVPEEDFEGMEVAGSRVVIKNTGDGLSDAMDVEGLHVTLGDRIFFVHRGRLRSGAVQAEEGRRGQGARA